MKSTWFSATAVIPQVRQEWSLSDSAVAWLTISVQWGFVFGAVVSAACVLSDVLKATRLIFVSSVGAAAANLMLLFADGFALGVVARAATGFFIAGVYPPALKLISTWYRDRRGAAMGLLVGALTVSSGVPHLVNGLGGLSWRTVITVTSMITVAGGAIILGLVKEGPYPFPAAAFHLRQIPRVLWDRPTRLAIGGYVCHMWELYAMWSWFLAFFMAALQRHGREDLALAAYVTFAMFVAGGAGNYMGGWLGDRFGRERTASVMMAMSALCALGIGQLLQAPLWVLIAAGMVWGYTVVADSAQFSALVTELADQSYVGTALTLQMALGFLFTGTTIWLIPMAQGLVGWQWAFSVLAVGPMAGMVAMRRLRRLRAL